MWFVYVVLTTFTGSMIIGVLGMAFMILAGGAVFWGCAALIHRCWEMGWWWLIPLVWAGIEAVRSFAGPLAFPWALLAHPLWSQPWLAQGAAGGTIFFVSAWCAAVNLVVAAAVFPSKDPLKNLSGNALFRLSVVCMIVVVASLWRWGQTPVGPSRVVTLAQPGVNLGYTRGADREAAISFASRELGRQISAQTRPDLVVLPEGYAKGGEIPPDNPFGAVPPFPLLQGGTVRKGDRAYQGAFLFDPGARGWQATQKERLVILGEYLPFTNIIPYDSWMNLGFSSFTPGRHQLMEVNGLKLGTLICYEGLFSDTAGRMQAEGANLLAVISIDDWYTGTPAWDMLWQSTVWRAIETGLPVARSGGLGRTLAVDARGRILALVEPNVRVARPVEITTPAKGDGFEFRMAFVWLCFCALAFICCHWAWEARTARGRGEASEQ
jgi:apolipoprotein N-acyltransferase